MGRGWWARVDQFVTSSIKLICLDYYILLAGLIYGNRSSSEFLLIEKDTERGERWFYVLVRKRKFGMAVSEEAITGLCVILTPVLTSEH